MNNISGIHSTIAYQGVSGFSGKAGTSVPVGTSGTIGIHGISGTSGPMGIQDFSEELMRKYHMRFKIEISSVSNGFLPTYKITDNSGIEYQFRSNTMTHAHKEVDEYISLLITKIRQEKINNLINE
jgi:hypothetical protein